MVWRLSVRGDILLLDSSVVLCDRPLDVPQDGEACPKRA